MTDYTVNLSIISIKYYPCLQLNAIPNGVTNIGFLGFVVFIPVLFSIIFSIPSRHVVPPTRQISSTL